MVEATVQGKTLQFQTKSDLFSPKDLDQGTRLLLTSVKDFNYHTALDWGCGWGAISLFLAAFNPKATIYGLDSDISAIRLTKDNAKLNQLVDRITVLASDSFSELPQDLCFDLIASNPPTHRGREVVDTMIEQSFGHLKPNGRLVIVVESRLKPWVARTMKRVFGQAEIVKRGPKNVVLKATRDSV